MDKAGVIHKVKYFIKLVQTFLAKRCFLFTFATMKYQSLGIMNFKKHIK